MRLKDGWGDVSEILYTVSLSVMLFLKMLKKSYSIKLWLKCIDA